MNKFLIVLIVLGCFFNIMSCTNDNGTRRALDDLGMYDINTTGYEPYACGKEYSYSTGFTAKNAQNKQVKGVVCCTLLDYCTVRFSNQSSLECSRLYCERFT